VRVELKLHPDSVCPSVTSIEVDIEPAEAGRLSLRYVVTGAIDALLLAPPAAPIRVNGLWQYSCFEAFLASPEGGYHEFNFAPSTEWAAYRFDFYRAGMADALVLPPHIEIAGADGQYELSATIGLPPAASRLGLSAVIEEKGGNKSYWALSHAPGKPDFHHPDCFVLGLPPAV
jgi:hypothetical protein